MITVDPATQCEVYSRSRSPLLASVMMYALMADSFGLFPQIKKPRPGHEPWYFVDIPKAERKGLSYKETIELRRYKWTLEQISKRTTAKNGKE